MGQPRNSDCGFSLIETLVALFVISLISTAAGLMLLDSLRASDRIDTSAASIRSLEVANGMLRADIGAMTRRASTGPDGYLPATGSLGVSGERDGLVMAFVRGGWSARAEQDALRSDLLRVEYHREADRLLRRAYLAPDPATGTEMIERVLLTGMRDFSVRYYSDGSWATEWSTPAGDEAPRLPQLIEVTVTFEDGHMLRQNMLAGGGLS